MVVGERSNLKILQAMHFPLEGAGTGYYVHNLASALVNRGNRVGVVYAQSPNCTRKDTTYERFPVDFKKGDLDFLFPVFESHPLGGDLNFGSIGQDNYLKYCGGFERVLDRAIDVMSPDVVNVHHGWTLGEMLDRKGIPYFVTLHGTEAKAFDLYPGYQSEVLRGLKGAQGIIALTDDQRQEAIEKYGVDPDRVSVITSGIDTDFFSPRIVDKQRILGSEGIEVGSHQPVVLYVGRLTAVKGVEYLVDAAAHLKAGGEDPRILVAGDGNLRAQLDGVKETHELSNLDFLGMRTHLELLELYNLAISLLNLL